MGKPKRKAKPKPKPNPKPQPNSNPIEVVMGYHLKLNITKNEKFGQRFKILVDQIDKLKRPEDHDIKIKPLESWQVATIDFIEDIVDENGNVTGESGPICRLKMRLDSYYMIAYQRKFKPGSKVYEFEDVAGFQALKGSQMLEETVRYPNQLEGRFMGYMGLWTAVKNLRDGENVGKSLLTLALFISESVRFRWIAAEHLNQFLIENIDLVWKLEPWMTEMVHSWKPYSDLARDYKVDENGTPIDPSKLPLEATDLDWKLRKTFGILLFKMSEYRNRAAAVCVMKLTQEKPGKQNEAAEE